MGPDSTPAQRLHTYARYTAAETEFWRSHRACAGVLHFCGLGYSRSDGQTSDHWADIEKLTWEPEFYKYVRDAFAPVGLMIDAWAEEYVISTAQAFPVVVINDLDTAWEGTLRFRLLGNGATVQEKTLPCTVPPLGSKTLTFTLDMPAQEGKFQVEAALVKPRSETVCSLRDFTLINEEERRARFGLAMGKHVTASSSRNDSGALAPEAVCDGKLSTRWSSDFSDVQWLAVDLGKTETVSRVVLDWDPAFAKAYALDASIDGQTWKEIHHAQNGRGGSEEIRFTPVEARWIRLRGIQRATTYGYSLWEFRVFR